ncbi:RTX toxin [Corallococcus praedator]|uniref:RTX toxin n=1 Tax=Corallococcus praedator TaxID=2316724 RepID=A0ABX9QP11_9BACT|nr:MULTISPECIES: RTX toxin [Corallococcus]RKH21502.1 RTX toxin [Corallococcus sp. CA047B]RKH35745.1 RTX toxin [Corallococcus sp. CA031C]RKI14003.1 RTX toxin [Corallococcus praedator]
MSVSSVGFPRTWRTLRKAAVVLSALTFGITGCSTQPSTPQQQEQEDSATASFSIKASDFYDASGASRGGSRSAFSPRASQVFSFTDVSTLRIDVKDKATNSPLYVNFDLRNEAGEWNGTLPFLPRDKTLVFSARALNASGTLLFHGTTEQTLAIGGQSIIIVLTAANDGRAISIPRIRKISVPSAFGSDQSGNVSFTVEANTGENLDYEIISAGGSGTFYPPTGSISLAATVGTFVSQYAPPTVSSNTEFEHTVKVTNEAGHSVSTTFKTRVKPPGTTDGVIDTGIQVLFNPVINTLNSSRVLGTGNVIFQASVADNEAASSLQYAWSFAPASGTSFDPLPSFSGATNPATLRDYTTAVQGIITLEVTDGDGGKTTLRYPLTPNQFPDNPTVEGGLTGINSIRAGESHTCVLFNSGALRCWGRNTLGQLGYGNTFTVGDNEQPYTAGDVALVGVGARLALGGNHTCALLDTGLVRCWGQNTHGQLGYNTTEHVGDGEAIASYGYVNLGGIAVKLAAGYEHTCALMNTGKVRCWGRNNYGQLGRGDTQDVGDDEQVSEQGSDVEVGGAVKNIVAGGHHTCALLDTGDVRCWGYNGHGQLGYGDTETVGNNEHPSVAGSVAVGGPVMQLTAGENHTCALLNTGNVRCWGYNGFGQLGYGNTNTLRAPTGDVVMGGQVLQVSAGKQHTCALLSTGDLKCWGSGASGRLGYGSAATLLAPPASGVDLDGSTAFQVTTGASHTCALLSTGAARCWGDNAFGQLGYGNVLDIGDNELPSSAGDIQVLAP